MKTTWPILLSLLLLAAPAAVQAQNVYSTNADGSIYTYSTNADGSAGIVAYAGPPWVVTIPTNINGLRVTSIGASAFPYGLITSVTIPNSVTNIGDGAFYECFHLTTVTIGSGVTSIGAGVFYDCDSLTSVTIPNNVTNIGDDAFAYDYGLTSVTIPNSVTSIGDDAFAYTPLTSVTIPGSVTTIGVNTFYGCTSLTNATIDNGVTSIGDYAFVGCTSLTAITVDTNNPAYSSANGVLFDKSQTTLIQYPGGLGGSYTITNSVTYIGEGAFEACSSLTSVTIPGSVTSIGSVAFAGCTSLTNVTIPNSVTNIGEGAFEACSSLTSVTIPSSVTSIGGGAFWDCTSLTNATIGSGVTSIEDNAFYDCTSLTSVTIGANVTIIGDSAFWDCTSLTRVTIPGSVTNIGDDAFEECASLTSVTIPNSVTSIGDSAFELCISLTSVTIPGSVTNIGDGAFESDSLTNVTIPASVTSIGENAFLDCTRLTAITVDTNNPAYSTLNGVLFDKTQATFIQYPGGSAGGSYTISNSVTSIGDSAFWDCTSLTSVTIPGSVTSIGYEAFFRCTNLTSITIPGSVTNIGFGVFEFCTRLTNATIDKGVSSIGNSAFSYDDGLTSVTIPGSVTSIGAAFQNCHSLTGLYFQGNSPIPNNSTFFSGDPATVYYLPGTTGWGAMFDGRPTAPWFLPNPLILTHSAGFGVQPGGFGFTISWATNGSVVVEAATNLANPVWIPVSTNTLTGGTNYFSDPQWTNYPDRFYRVASAFTVGGMLTGLRAGDTVTLQDNGSDNLTLSNNGTFTFPTALPNSQSYSVTVSALTGLTPPQCTLMNASGTISGANVTNVAVQCARCPAFTGDKDLDMYNAAVSDGTANGGVPAVMFTVNGGPFRVTARGFCSDNVAAAYSGWAVVTQVVGSNSCSSTTFPSGTTVLQFGGALECGSGGPFEY